MLCKVGISNFLCSGTVQFTIFKVIFAYAIELSSNHFRKLRTVIHDISKQTEQRTHIGKIFIRWHLAIAITS